MLKDFKGQLYLCFKGFLLKARLLDSHIKKVPYDNLDLPPPYSLLRSTVSPSLSLIMALLARSRKDILSGLKDGNLLMDGGWVDLTVLQMWWV